MMYAARVYPMPDNRTVQVFQFKKVPDSHEYLLDDVRFKIARLDDAQAVGELIQAAVQGRLHPPDSVPQGRTKVPSYG